MAPSHAWGCYPNKGVIQAGSDADIVIADMRGGCIIDRADLHSKSKLTAWQGFKTTASVDWTLVRGRVVVKEGELVGEQGWGQPVKQKMPAPTPQNLDKTMDAIIQK